MARRQLGYWTNPEAGPGAGPGLRAAVAREADHVRERIVAGADRDDRIVCWMPLKTRDLLLVETEVRHRF